MKKTVAYILALVAFAVTAMAHSPPVATGKTQATDIFTVTSVQAYPTATSLLAFDKGATIPAASGAHVLAASLEKKGFPHPIIYANAILISERRIGTSEIVVAGGNTKLLAHRPNGDGLVDSGGVDFGTIVAG